MQDVLERWKVDVRQVREQMYRAPTPRERERWHALWLLARGWSAVQVAAALERDPHTIGEWVAAFGQSGPAALTFAPTGGSPPPSNRTPRRNGKRPSKRRPGPWGSSWRTGIGKWCASSSGAGSGGR